MVDRARSPERAAKDGDTLPRPTLRFRLRAWRAFQRALDPLAPPRPLPPHPRRGLERVDARGYGREVSQEERLQDVLLRRAQKAIDAAAEVVAHSEVITEVSAELRHTGMTTRCAWCSRYRLGERWVQLRPTNFVFDSKTSHGICDDCVQALRDAGLTR